jgi:ureidoacrylate peracid hydrolase
MGHDPRPDRQAELPALLAPAQTALLLVDVQNDYCHPEGSLGRHGIDMTPVAPAIANIQKLIAVARETGVAVVFIRNWHETWTDSAAWAARSPHSGRAARAGSWGAEFFAIAPEPGDPVINKQRYSAFIGTSLDATLHALKRNTLVMTGIATNVCVESTARHAVFLDYRIVFAADATGTSDGAFAQEATLDTIAQHFGPVATTERIVETLRHQAGRNDRDPIQAVRGTIAS